MGLLSFYIGYRKGRRAERRRSSSIDSAYDDVAADEVCDNCGYEARQHSDEGDCPHYG